MFNLSRQPEIKNPGSVSSANRDKFYNDMDKGTNFSWFSNSIDSCEPQGLISFPEPFHDKIRHPLNYEIFAKIKAAKAAGNKALVDQLKQGVYYFTPAVRLRRWRNSRNIYAFTGLCPIDIDRMPPEQAAEYKRFLFDHYPVFYSVWLSASGHGVRGLIKIPVVQTIQEYKAYFWAIYEELKQYEYHFDTQLQTPVQPMYQSYDPDILIRQDPETWQAMAPPPVKSKPVRSEVTKSAEPLPILPKGHYSDKQIISAGQIIEKIAKSMFRKITDIGHPNVVKIGLILGGYAGEGLITQAKAIEIMDEGITGHNYLNQKADKYQVTARWAISEGMDSPLKLKTDRERATDQQINDFLTA